MLGMVLVACMAERVDGQGPIAIQTGIVNSGMSG
jgi:hypothetical protein